MIYSLVSSAHIYPINGTRNWCLVEYIGSLYLVFNKYASTSVMDQVKLLSSWELVFKDSNRLNHLATTYSVAQDLLMSQDLCAKKDLSSYAELARNFIAANHSTFSADDNMEPLDLSNKNNSTPSSLEYSTNQFTMTSAHNLQCEPSNTPLDLSITSAKSPRTDLSTVEHQPSDVNILQLADANIYRQHFLAKLGLQSSAGQIHQQVLEKLYPNQIISQQVRIPSALPESGIMFDALLN